MQDFNEDQLVQPTANDVKQLHAQKIMQIRDFIRAHKSAAKQGTEAWLQSRQSIIGGSEMSVITGDSPFSSVRDLVMQKTGLAQFHGNTATRWGNVLEHLHVSILQELFDGLLVFSTGSIDGAIKGHRYSPDGIAVLNAPTPTIVLLEFKSPLRSIPIGRVPNHYLPQVLAGLQDIGICELGVFINNCYRICRMNQFMDDSRYLYDFHSSDGKKKFISGPPLALGIMTFFQTTAQFEKYGAVNVITIENEIIESEIEKVLERTQKGQISVKYGRVTTFPERFKSMQLQFNPRTFTIAECIRQSNTYREKCIEKEHFYVGKLAWKCFLSDMIVVEKIHDYLNQFEPKIDTILQNIKQLNACNSFIDKMELLESLYPL
jgi:hypothetical protein